MNSMCEAACRLTFTLCCIMCVPFSGYAIGTPPTGGLSTNKSSNSASRSFAVAFDAQGFVWTWGDNTYGQLGDGSLVQRPIPSNISGLGSVAGVSAGDAHTAALKTDGTIWTWGANSNGQLGDGTTSPRLSPGVIGGIADAIAVSAGHNHTVALKADGTVWTWGGNHVGQLGDGTTTQRNAPVQVTSLSGIVDVSASEFFTIAVKNDGSVWAWGSNMFGQLGDGTTTNRPMPVQVTNLTDVIAVSTGSNFCAALKADGSVWTWGSNRNGRLGDGTTSSRLTPVQVATLSSVTKLAGGANHMTALKADGTVWAWGLNFTGQLGSDLGMESHLPVHVPGVSNVVGLAAGKDYSIVLKEDGTVFGWGENQFGQLGDGTYTSRQTLGPVQVGILRGAIHASAGEIHTIVALADSTASSWGLNSFGQLGDGTTTPRPQPVPVSGLSSPVMVAAGGSGTSSHFSLAVRADGTVWSWGGNSSGQLGDGTIVQRNEPVQVSGTTNAQSVTIGARHALVANTDGTVLAWGANSSGQLGDNTTTQRLTPIAVNGLTEATTVAAGLYHSVALKADGTLRAWGSNINGQLGDGTTTQRNLPVTVGGLTGIVQIAAGAYHTVAVKDDGTVWAWGRNMNGQLGDGTTTQRNSPVQVSGLSEVVAVSAGFTHTAAITSGGTVWSWGDNSSGQLGDGTTIQRNAPVPVGNLVNAVSVSAGVFHTLVILNDGTIRGWGSNVQGQLLYALYPQKQSAVRLVLTAFDSDQDGMTDTWEQQYFGDLSHAGGTDSDGDGLTDIQEHRKGSHPMQPDVDGDLLTDFVDPYPNDYYNNETPTLSIIGGNNQVGEPGAFNAAPFDVGVWTAAATDPLVNAPVTFTVTQGGGTLAELVSETPANPLAVLTDEDGSARAFYRHPAIPGTSSVVTVTAGTAQLVFGTTTDPNADTDGDEMSDGWEINYGLDPLVDDADGDLDGDSLTNLEEFQQGTDPTDYYNGVAPLLSIEGGNEQHTPPAEFNAESFVVMVKNLVAMTPMANAPVTFTVQSGGGRLALANVGNPELVTTLTLMTDEQGRAAVYYQQPDVAEADSVIVASAGSSEAIFTSTVASAVDSDNNGLPDQWELQHFGRLSVNSSGDADLDGFTNLAEYQNGTHPDRPDFTDLTDNDSDTLPDAWEQRYLGTLEYSADDDSSAGVSLGLAFQQGLNPLGAPVIAPGLRAWYRAAFPNMTLQASTDRVRIWADSSGHGFHLRQDSNNRRPDWTDSGLNNLPTILFPGGRWMTSVAGNVLDEATNATVIVIFSPWPSQSANATLITQEAAGGGGFAVRQSGSDVNQYRFEWRRALDLSVQGAADAIGAMPYGRNMLVFVKDGTAQTGYLNGELKYTGSVAADLLAAVAPLTVGSKDGDPGVTFRGEVAEILIYDRALSPAERQQLDDVMSVRYRLFDIDDNGLPDDWERQYFGDIGVDATADPDADGLTNAQESTIGTHPVQADTDGDGMPDGWEKQYGLHPLVSDTQGDADGDGRNSLAEFLAGSSPYDYYDGAKPKLAPLLSDGALGADDSLDVLVTTLDEQPLANAPLRFTVMAGGHALLATVNGTPDSTWVVRTDQSGVARIYVRATGAVGPNRTRVEAEYGDQVLTSVFTHEAPAMVLPSVDADADGLPDVWELAHFGNLTAKPMGDADNDGIANLAEFQGGSNPTVPQLDTATDTDLDGLPDAWELRYIGHLDLGADDSFESMVGTFFEYYQQGLLPRRAGLPNLPGLRAWYSSGNYNYDPLSGGLLEWIDSSGNGLHLRQDEAASQPHEYYTEYGLPPARFERSERMATPLRDVLNGSTDVTIFALIQPLAIQAVDAQVLALNDGGPGGLILKQKHFTGDDYAMIWPGTEGQAVRGGRTSLSLSPNQRGLLTFTKAGPMQGGRLNDGSLHTSLVEADGDSGLSTISIGRHAEGDSMGFEGNIATLVVFNRALSIAEQTQVRRALMYNYNIPLANDVDDDGLDDLWELRYFPDLSTDPSLDPDGDGLDNLAEYIADSNPLDYFNGDPPELTIVGGDAQTAMMDHYNEEPLTVLVEKNNQPVVGASVAFVVQSGEGGLADSFGSNDTDSLLFVVTDEAGLARAYFRQPSEPDVDSLIQVAAGDATVSFTAHSVSGSEPYAGQSLALASLRGDWQYGLAGCFNDRPLLVTVWDESGTAPLSGAPVVFTVSSGGGQLAVSDDESATLATSLSLITDNNGRARVYFRHAPFAGVEATINVQSGAATALYHTRSITRSMAAGRSHALGLKGDGSVLAWGDNTHGQLGNGTTTASLVPVPVANLEEIISVAAAGDHSLALGADGSLWYWGGSSSQGATSAPILIAGINGVGAAAPGDDYALTLKKDGTVWEVPYPSGAAAVEPRQVVGLKEVVSIAAGVTDNLAVKEDGTVWWWAAGGASDLPAEQVYVLDAVAMVACGRAHNLALKRDGTVWSWGENDYGQLGREDGYYHLPQQIMELSRIVFIAAAGDSSVAVRDDGTVWAWGANGNGQLGNGGMEDRVQPRPVTEIFGAVTVVAGPGHVLALKSDGTVWAWGDNTYWQAEPSSVPAQVGFSTAIPPETPPESGTPPPADNPGPSADPTGAVRLHISLPPRY